MRMAFAKLLTKSVFRCLMREYFLNLLKRRPSHDISDANTVHRYGYGCHGCWSIDLLHGGIMGDKSLVVATPVWADSHPNRSGKSYVQGHRNKDSVRHGLNNFSSRAHPWRDNPAPKEETRVAPLPPPAYAGVFVWVIFMSVDKIVF